MSVILLVDDSEHVRNLLAKLLRHEGYEIRTASSAIEALAVLADVSPNLLLLDITMPEMDGLSLLEVMHGHPKWAALPVIMFTALDAQPFIDRAEQLGAKAYCVKGRDSFTQVLGHIRQHIHA
jgi:CheY-like chemotaxis protein